ncbi:hypothetical protein GEMRC1_009117 [Eukaryota sp. GEM-RC1]
MLFVLYLWICFSLYIASVSCAICHDLTPERTNYANISLSAGIDWSISYDRSVWSSPPFVTPQLVYFSTNVGMMSVDLLTGQLLRQTKPIRFAYSQLYMSSVSNTIAVLAFPDETFIRHFHLFSADLSSEVLRFPVSLPGIAVSDDRGLLCSDQNLMVRFDFEGKLLHKSTSLGYATFHPTRLGYIRYNSNQLDVINKDLHLLYSIRYPGIRAVSTNMASGMIFFTFSNIMKYPKKIFIAGFHDSNREVFVKNFSIPTTFHQVLFTCVLNDGSVVFAVGSTTSNSVSLSLYKIQLTGHGFEDVELVFTLSPKANYESHVVYPSNLMAISYTDVTSSQPIAKVVLIDLNSHVLIDSIEYENSKGGSAVGYGSNCLLYIIKGRYNIPNTLHHTCFT